MKKRILVYILCGIMLFIIVAAVLFDFNSDKSGKKKNIKITVADTTLTSRTCMT